MSTARVRPLPRLMIENVSPELDAGRFPIKRVMGDRIPVGVDIFKDGHDLIAGQILYRPSGTSSWHHAPLTYCYDPDRWFGEFSVDRLGLWQFTLEAWPDVYRTFSSELKKRISGGQDVAPELLEGVAILRRIASHRGAQLAARLRALAERLANPELPVSERLELAFSTEVEAVTHGPAHPDECVRYERILEVLVERQVAKCGAWYELFPRSQSKDAGKHGTFADVEERIPELAALGFDVLYLPPVHPIGHTHRKGRNNSRSAQPDDVGSPWAIGSEEGGHMAVHPELGTLSDFDQMAKTAQDFGMELALDYALQCSPDHPWCREHPEWFFIRADGTIRYAENPPKKYEDIYPLNFWCADREGLWQACLAVVLFWIQHGVHIFRVDNPHTKPLSFWEWMLAEVRKQHPEVVFLSESFTRPKRMKALAKVGFSQSYTYFTWKNSSWDIQGYLAELTQSNMADYFRPNFFANTPDILHEYLQTGGRPAFRIRLLLAATLSPTYGIYSGFELCEGRPLASGSEDYLNSEKYEIRPRNFNQFGNIKQDIAKLNRIRRENPALGQLDNLVFLYTEYEQVLAYCKSSGDNILFIIVNLDPHRMHECMVHLPLETLGIGEEEMFDVEDLLTGVRHTWRGRRNYVRLEPTERVGHVMRLIRPHADG